MTKSPQDGPPGAILQKDNETYAIVPRTPVGLVTADHLEKIAAAIRKYDIPICKITSGQRFALVGLKEEQLDEVWQDLGMEQAKVKSTELCMHFVQACPGTDVCRYGKTDSLGLGLELEEKFTGMKLPSKFKVGVSGCTYSCAQSYVRDIGLVGTKSGWIFAIGGNSGGRPRIADRIAKGLDKDAALDLLNKFMEYYVTNAKTRERVSHFVDRIGIDAIKEAILTEDTAPVA